MKTYRTSDGESLRGATARDVIKALRASSHDPCASLQKFMDALSVRAYRQTRRHIPTDSPVRFVAALVRAGLLIEDQNR